MSRGVRGAGMGGFGPLFPAGDESRTMQLRCDHARRRGECWRRSTGIPV